MNGEFVRVIRHYKGMTQPQFAEWLGVAESTIAQVEAGRRNVSTSLALKIAHKFDVADPDFIAYKDRVQNLKTKSSI